MSRAQLMIVVASVRPGRIGLPIATWVRERAEARDDVDVDFVDLQELALPFMDEPKHPRLGQYSHGHTIAWSNRVRAADAFVFVTPEYNYSYAPALKNALDFLFKEWGRKPVAQVSYGGVSAGLRGAVALDPVLDALGMVRTRANVAIPFAGKRVTDGAFESEDSLDESLDGVLDEVIALSGQLAALRSGRMD